MVLLCQLELEKNLTGSFGYAKDKLVGSIGNWIILMILTIIPIVNFIAMGTYLKVYRGEDPKVENIGKSFVDGLLIFIITFLYMLIPTVILLILGGGSIFAAGLTGSQAAIAGVGIGVLVLCIILYILFGLIILCIIVAFFFALFAKPAVVNFARNGFSAAFRLREIFGMISKAGWLKYIVSLILFWLIFGAIIHLCLMIPIVGWILLIFILPFLYCWGSKYLANLFE